MFVWTLLWWAPLALLLQPVPHRGYLLAALAVMALGPVPLLLRAFVGREYPSAMRRVLVFRPFWYVQLFMPLVVMTGLLAALAGLPFGRAGASGRVALAVALGVVVVAAVLGYFGSRRLVVRSLELPFASLPQAFDGLRIVQLSDLHVGPHTSARFLRRVLERVIAANADLIVVTGDQVDDYAHDVQHFVSAFGSLTAPLGVFAIAGNHDVYAGWEGVNDGLSRAGFRVLVNDAQPLTRNGGRLWLAGTGDPAGGSNPLGVTDGPGPDINRTLARVPAGAFVIALAHNPVLWPALARRDVQLTLSGHTHYGQLAIPRLQWSVASLFLTHAMGLHQDGERTLYINPGTNYWGIPFRLGTPPEISVHTLRRRAV